MEPPRKPRRRYYRDLSYSHRLSKATDALAALTDDDDVRTAYAAVGIDPAWCDTFAEQIAAARAAMTRQGTARGAQLESTDDQNDALAAAAEEYKRLGIIARVAFIGEPDSLRALGLTGRAPGSIPQRLDRYRLFLAAAAEPHRLAILEGNNVDPLALEAFSRLVDTAATLAGSQNARTAESQNTTHHKRTAFAPMDLSMRKLQMLAPAVLRSSPQLAEKLGLLVR